MKKLAVVAFVVGVLLCLGACASKPNTSLSEYHDSGKYAKQVAAVTQQAMNYMNRRLADKAHRPQSPAIVLDIDETSLSNWQAISKPHFRFPFSWSQNKLIEEEPAIPGTLALYQQALQQHVAVFFITGRVERLRATTIENLHRAGYRQWAELILKPHTVYDTSNAPFKAAARKKITESGYRILLNMGDQCSDLRGGYADAVFKLPNPYYFIP